MWIINLVRRLYEALGWMTLGILLYSSYLKRSDLVYNDIRKVDGDIVKLYETMVVIQGINYMLDSGLECTLKHLWFLLKRLLVVIANI